MDQISIMDMTAEKMIHKCECGGCFYISEKENVNIKDEKGLWNAKKSNEIL